MKTLALVLSGLLLSATAQASERYRVELMMFAYIDENAAREEHWPLLKQRADAEEAAIQAALAEEADAEAIFTGESEVLATETPLSENTQASENTPESDSGIESPDELSGENLPVAEEQSGQQYLPVANLEFANAAERFGYRSDIKIVWHQAWIEELQDAENAQPHPVEASYEEENFRVIVKGNVRVHRSRYLHFTPQLEVDQEIFTLPDPEPTPVVIPVEVTESTFQSYNTAQTFSTGLVNGQINNESAPPIFPEVSITPPPQPEWLPLRAAEVTLSRRMRSGELHYLDHPLLGMVIRVTPYEEPEVSADSVGSDSENQQ
ncbi:MAG: CsiV family protein [Thalassolituus sp.]